jgi:hypothetical protein
MKKYIDIFLKVILSLILILPILGVTHVFPAPTADMYGNAEAFAFIQMLTYSASYIDYIMAIVFIIALVLIWTRRMAAAALLILPVTVNVIGFHLFLDNGLLVPGSIPADIMLAINLYFIWQYRSQYSQLLSKSH